MPRVIGSPERAFERKLANRYALHKLYYYKVRQQFDLLAQMACLTFAQVAAAYKRDRRKKVSFRPLASMPYDRHLLHYRDFKEVSLSTLQGRIVVPMVMGDYQASQLGRRQAVCRVGASARWQVVLDGYGRIRRRADGRS